MTMVTRMSNAFEYVAWLGNHELPAEDEDYEWCAVFIVLADSVEAASAWGDSLTHAWCSESFDVFLRSSAEEHECTMAVVGGQKHPCPNLPALSRAGNERVAIPVVLDGQPAAAEYIGW